MSKIKALPNKILANMVEKPGGYRKLKSGILLADRDQDMSGIRPRWFQVISVGKNIDWVDEGQYLYVSHGRWSNGVKIDDEMMYLLDNEECLAISDTNPILDMNSSPGSK